MAHLPSLNLGSPGLTGGLGVDWKAKVELFEQLRREHEFGIGTVAGVAAKFGVHRRMVRQAIGWCAAAAASLPAARPSRSWTRSRRSSTRCWTRTVGAPRKQRHTARRIHRRILTEFPGVAVAELTVRNHVRARRRALGLVQRETFVPQSYGLGQEAQVDWYEAWADLGGERTRLQVFAMRSMASGAAFHRAYLHATQQAFLEAHEHAFAYFGGVFRLLRYDNLASAVRKILRGHRREETVRFMAFRSHWRFAAEFCTPGEGHEKGGVEGEVGYFRRNHLVPVPAVADLDALNALLLAAAARTRRGSWMGAREAVGAAMAVERDHLLRRAAEGFDLAEVTFPLVDKQGCVTVKTNAYSVPARAGTRVEARVYPLHVEVWHGGPSDRPPRALPRPPPAGAGPRALPRRAEPQARRVGRVQAAGAMARRPVAGPPATTRSGIGCGPGTASRTAPAPWWRCCCWAGSLATTRCGPRSPRRSRSAPATSRRCAIC